jgi:hypothetical protein
VLTTHSLPNYKGSFAGGSSPWDPKNLLLPQAISPDDCMIRGLHALSTLTAWDASDRLFFSVNPTHES